MNCHLAIIHVKFVYLIDACVLRRKLNRRFHNKRRRRALSQIDNRPILKSFSLHIASINYNRKAGRRVKNYKYIIVMMQINPYFLLKLSGV